MIRVFLMFLSLFLLSQSCSKKADEKDLTSEEKRHVQNMVDSLSKKEVDDVIDGFFEVFLKIYSLEELKKDCECSDPIGFLKKSEAVKEEFKREFFPELFTIWYLKIQKPLMEVDLDETGEYFIEHFNDRLSARNYKFFLTRF